MIIYYNCIAQKGINLKVITITKTKLNATDLQFEKSEVYQSDEREIGL